MFTAEMWANLCLYTHFLWVLFVVLAVPCIVIGGLRGWGFARNPIFRWVHLGMISVVVFLEITRSPCPLTVWENQLRELAGDKGYPGTFMAQWVSRILYYDFPRWVFTLTYCLFGLLVVVLFFVWPPRRKR